MSSHGRSTRRFKRLAAELRARKEPCCLCGQPIDYLLPRTDRNAFTVAHRQPVSLYPHMAEDPTNIAGAAHNHCNAAEGNRPTNNLINQGATSNTW